MFKKEISISSTNIMSNKERKEFINSKLKGMYPGSLIEEHLCNKKWSNAKLSGSKKKIILLNEDPIFFEYEKEIYFPTIYVLNMIPDILTNVCLIYKNTDTYLENGADLMLKGVLNREFLPKSFKIGALFKIVTEQGITTSIGVTTVSSSILSTIGEGKFLSIVHRINDAIWELGSKQIHTLYIKETKVETKPLENSSLIKEEIIDPDKVKEKFIDDVNTNKDIIIIDQINPNENIHLDLNKLPDELSEINNNNGMEKIDNTFEPNTIENVNDNIDPKCKEEKIINTEELDSNLIKIFYTVINFSVTLSSQLPIDPGKFLQSFLKPVALEFKIEINVKNSSFKGINNFLKYISKEHKTIIFAKKFNDERFISIIQDKSAHKINIDEFGFKNIKKQLCCDKIDEEINKKENILLDDNERIEIKQYYKPLNLFANYFSKIHPEHKKGDCYEMKEINEILLNYLKSKNMINKNEVTLDTDLSEALRIRQNTNIIQDTQNEKKVENDSNLKIEDILNSKSNLNEKKNIITINAMISLVKENLIEKDSVVRINDNENTSVLISNAKLHLKITAKKMYNKNVTLLDGLESFIDLKEATQLFAKNFACSVCLKRFGSQDSILIQGYWVHELIELLEKELKVQRKFITIEDKLKLKKKNN